jgi:hypothetical protein
LIVFFTFPPTVQIKGFKGAIMNQHPKRLHFFPPFFISSDLCVVFLIEILWKIPFWKDPPPICFEKYIFKIKNTKKLEVQLVSLTWPRSFIHYVQSNLHFEKKYVIYFIYGSMLISKFNATFNYFFCCCSVLLMEETGVPWENHWSVASQTNFITLYYIKYTSPEWDSNSR